MISLVLSLCALAVAIASLTVAIVRKDAARRATDALLEDAEARFKAFLATSKSRLGDMNDAAARLANADQRFEALAAKVEDLAGQLEGGLDERLDARLKPVVSQLDKIAVFAGLPRTKRVTAEDEAKGH